MTGYIYLVTNLVNHKSYVGQTMFTVARRWQRHLRDAQRGSEKAIHAAIRKYGEDNFKVETICAACAETKGTLVQRLNDQEVHYIKFFGTFADDGHGYNLTMGGDLLILAKESRIKISQSLKKKVLPTSYKKGYKHSKESRANMSATRIGMVPWNKGVKGSTPWNKGKKASAEHNEKNRAGHMGQPAWNKGTSKRNLETQVIQ